MAAAVVLAATAFAASQDWWQGDSSGGTVSVRTTMPTGPVIYIRPECTLDRINTLKNTDGSTPDHMGGPGGPIPAGFMPVRAVRCSAYGDSKSLTQTQAEIRDPSALNDLLAAYRTTSVLEPETAKRFCPLYADMDPTIALVDAHGTAVWPAPPRDDCHHVIEAVKTAVGNDKWVVTGSVTTH